MILFALFFTSCSKTDAFTEEDFTVELISMEKSEDNNTLKIRYNIMIRNNTTKALTIDAIGYLDENIQKLLNQKGYYPNLELCDARYEPRQSRYIHTNIIVPESIMETDRDNVLENINRLNVVLTINNKAKLQYILNP